MLRALGEKAKLTEGDLSSAGTGIDVYPRVVRAPVRLAHPLSTADEAMRCSHRVHNNSFPASGLALAQIILHGTGLLTSGTIQGAVGLLLCQVCSVTNAGGLWRIYFCQPLPLLHPQVLPI